MDTHIYTDKIKNITHRDDINFNVSHPIKNIMFDNIDFLRQLDASGKARPVVLDTIEKSLLCNSIYLGYDAFECPNCLNETFVCRKCHTRFCNSCGTKYAKQLASNVSSFALDVPHRHIVFTIPEQLRIFFIKDRSLLNLLFVAARNTICAVINNALFRKLKRKQKKLNIKLKNSYYLYKNFPSALDFGMIASLHTFGRDLKWNPHIHSIVPLISYNHHHNSIKRFSHFDFVKLRKTFQFEILRLLSEKLGNSFNDLKRTLYHHYPKGFYVYAKSHEDEAEDFDTSKNSQNINDCITYCMRYAARPALAESRITNYDSDNNSISWFFNDHKDNQRYDITESSIDFIKRLIIHIPDENFKMVRYFGFYANASQKKLSKIHQLLGNEQKATKSLRDKKKRLSLNKFKYRTHLIDSFNRDPLKCPCGYTMIFTISYNPLEGVSNDRAYRKNSIDEMRQLSIRRRSP